MLPLHRSAASSPTLASVNGTRIFFDVDGARVVWDGDTVVERPVMVLLPGGPGSSHMHYKRPNSGFDRFRSSFQMVYIDWRGAGRSDPAPPETMTLAQNADDVEAIREVLGIEQWIVLGASGGGAWAITYAAAYPQRVTHLIVLHSPARSDNFGGTAESIARRAGITDEAAIDVYRRFVEGELEDPVEEWAKPLRDTILQVQNATYTDPQKHPEAAENRKRAYASQPDEAFLQEYDAARWYLRDFARNYNAAEIGDRITAPTLVMTGEIDPVATPEHSELIHNAIPGSELHIHDGGHMPRGEEQAPFFDRIEEFLTR